MMRHSTRQGIFCHASSTSSSLPRLKSRHSTSRYTMRVRVYSIVLTFFPVTGGDAGGSPLSLDEIMKSPLFRPHTLPSADGNTFAVTLPDSSLALLSQGDHPTLGTPSWYFHPCHTADVVGEILAELAVGQEDGLRWLETWFMVLGNIVDFFAGSVV